MSSTESASAQRTPAWKRLGLKLKQPDAVTPPAGRSTVGQPGGSTGHKRRTDAPPHSDGSSPLKRARREDYSSSNNYNGTQTSSILQNGSSPAFNKTKKSVKFGETPTKNDAVSPPASRTKNNTTPGRNVQQKQTTPKKPKGPAKKQKAPVPVDTEPALQYLRQWKSSRENWKFNKNHQTTLINHVFDSKALPASDIGSFYEYIRDLKGAVRNRLRETAMEVQMQDVSAGKAGFPDDMMDVDDQQEKYDAILADILRRKREQQSPKRKFFNEAQYASDSEDGEVLISRVIKRMRAELIIDELSGSGDETENTNTSMSSKTVTGSDNNATVTTNGDKQVKLPDGAVGKRRRKLRVNMEDSDSSSSESEPDDSDATSSSGSSSEDSDSEEEADQRPDEDETSSSSSSSSSEDDDDSDDSGDDED